MSDSLLLNQCGSILSKGLSFGLTTSMFASLFGTVQAKYLYVLWGLQINALLVIIRQLFQFRSNGDFVHLMMASMFVVQAILCFPLFRKNIDSSNECAYQLTKLSIASVFWINLFMVFYSSYYDKVVKQHFVLDPKSFMSACPLSVGSLPHLGFCAMLAYRFSQYHLNKVRWEKASCSSSCSSSTDPSFASSDLLGSSKQTQTVEAKKAK